MAENRALWLDVAWILALSIGSLATIQFGFVTDTTGQISNSTPTAAFLFLFIAIIGSPLAILFSLPCWNFISPIQDRATIWESEFIVFIVTFTLLTVSSVYFSTYRVALPLKHRFLWLQRSPLSGVCPHNIIGML